MENKRILVIGGTGYIGKALAIELAKQEYQLTVLSRRPGQVTANIKYISGNVLDKDFLLANLKDFDIIIYLAAVIRTFCKKKYRNNIIGIKNTLAAMQANKIKKILYFSTQNIYLAKAGPYAASKKASEKIVRESTLDYMIIRPNFVYGVDQNNYFYQLYQIMKRFKICPLPGGGLMRFQPINKNDLVAITCQCLKNWQSGEIINASGKATLTLQEIATLIKKEGKLRCLTIKLPLWLLKPLKLFFPFDIDGLTEDRLPPPDANLQQGTAELTEDIKKILKL